MAQTGSQGEKILAYMQEGNRITAIDALNLCGCFRLSARIYDLRKKGYDIKSKTVNIGGKSFASYYLEKVKPTVMDKIRKVLRLNKKNK